MRALHLSSFERDAAALVDVLRTGPLQAPVSSCPGWDLAGLGAHVGQVHRWAAAALNGQQAPDEAPAADDVDVAAWVEEGAGEPAAAHDGGPRRRRVLGVRPAAADRRVLGAAAGARDRAAPVGRAGRRQTSRRARPGAVVGRRRRGGRGLLPQAGRARTPGTAGRRARAWSPPRARSWSARARRSPGCTGRRPRCCSSCGGDVAPSTSSPTARCAPRATRRRRGGCCRSRLVP
nr:maleylpyruvate isomerase N-terminal domain-containing protein [Angustibacter aerolatus]